MIWFWYDSRLGHTIPVCDSKTDSTMDNYLSMAKTALAERAGVKMKLADGWHFENGLYLVRESSIRSLWSFACIFAFYPRDALLSAVYAVFRCLSVSLSVTRRYIVSKRLNPSFWPPGSPIILFFTSKLISLGNIDGFFATGRQIRKGW